MEKIENLTAGVYQVTVTSLDNCNLKDSFLLKNPAAIRSTFEVTDVRCFGENSGEIEFGLTEGGTLPYLYSIDNQYFIKENIFTKLKSGRYELAVKDANGCRWEESTELAEPEEFYISLSEDQIINLGTPTQIQAVVSAPYESIVWSDKTVAGLTHSFTPMKSQEFKVTVTDKKGCQASDVLWVYVKSEREIFAPNSFSPNNDGTNDSFTIYGGSDVAKVKDLQVFDRWGNMIYQAQDIAPNDENMGWQGSFNGHLANQDNYIYKTTVEFIDGKIKNFSGEVLLMR
jgi:gliding motility-associated-like protein